MAIRLGADATTTSIAELQHLGATFVCRYLSDFPWKNLTKKEADELTAAGIDIVSNWENDVNDWMGGYAAGVRNATVAWHQHKACGGMDGRPIYFSVDMNANAHDFRLHEYFRGLGFGMTPGQVGVYGSTEVCNVLRSEGLVHWTWRTMSTGFDGGYGQPQDFNIEQTGYFNEAYDRDASITDDFGQWRVGYSPVGTPGPTQVKAPPPVVHLWILQMCAREDPAKPQGATTNAANVQPVQQALVAEGFLHEADKSWGRGAYGYETVAAYASWQRRLGYNGRDADGMPGLASLGRLGRAHGFVVMP